MGCILHFKEAKSKKKKKSSTNDLKRCSWVGLDWFNSNILSLEPNQIN